MPPRAQGRIGRINQYVRKARSACGHGQTQDIPIPSPQPETGPIGLCVACGRHTGRRRGWYLVFPGGSRGRSGHRHRRFGRIRRGCLRPDSRRTGHGPDAVWPQCRDRGGNRACGQRKRDCGHGLGGGCRYAGYSWAAFPPQWRRCAGVWPEVQGQRRQALSLRQRRTRWMLGSIATPCRAM